jgi:hypothetical protein
MLIVKNTKLQYHTECPGSPSDGLIFTVSKVEINNTDLDMAINAGYYSIIN